MSISCEPFQGRRTVRARCDRDPNVRGRIGRHRSRTVRVAEERERRGGFKSVRRPCRPRVPPRLHPLISGAGTERGVAGRESPSSIAGPSAEAVELEILFMVPSDFHTEPVMSRKRKGNGKPSDGSCGHLESRRGGWWGPGRPGVATRARGAIEPTGASPDWTRNRRRRRTGIPASVRPNPSGRTVRSVPPKPRHTAIVTTTVAQ